jgi:dihydroneopterin aldolase
MAIPLVTSWQLEKAAGEPPSIIRVKNLQSHINGPQDAWGRPGRPQPILVSAEVSLVQRFGVSSSRDAVAPDTVHYGQLSKAVLTVLGRIEGQAAKEDEKSLDFVMSSIWAYLTGVQTDGVAAAQAKPFLDMEFVRRLTVSIVLPKASLLGTGVGLTSSAVFQNSVMHIRSLSLNILELRIPTLVGVNENERAAKQVVIANIGVERYTNERDGYVELETVVVDVSETKYE